MKKYEFTGETMEYKGHTLHRIRGINEFKGYGEGGWIESERNLSQEGRCWVRDEAKVYGNARVYDGLSRGPIIGRAIVSGFAEVFGNAQIMNNAKIYDRAMVSGTVMNNAIVTEEGKVLENAIVAGDALVYGKAKISGHAELDSNAVAFGTANISGKTKLSTNTQIYNSTINKDIKIENEVDFNAILKILDKDDYLIAQNIAIDLGAEENDFTPYNNIEVGDNIYYRDILIDRLDNADIEYNNLYEPKEDFHKTVERLLITKEKITDAIDKIIDNKATVSWIPLREQDGKTWALVFGWQDGYVDVGKLNEVCDNEYRVCGKIAYNDSALQCGYDIDWFMPKDINSEFSDVWDTENTIESASDIDDTLVDFWQLEWVNMLDANVFETGVWGQEQNNEDIDFDRD